MKRFEAAFKKSGCGKLWWVTAHAKDENSVVDKMRSYVTGGYLLYNGPTPIK